MSFMGIVVAVSLLLGFLMMTPFCQKRVERRMFYRVFDQITTVILVLVGGWNIVWYAFSYWPMLWAVIALLSGSVMLLSSLLLQCSARYFLNSSYYRVYHRYMKFALPVALLFFFFLYAVTIVRINLGYPILS